MTFFFFLAKAVASITTAAPPTTTYCDVFALPYEWMDVQTVIHCLRLSFYLHFIISSPPLLFSAEMMTSVRFGWKQSGEWCSPFSLLPQASIKGLRAPGSISTLCSSKNSSPPIGRFHTHCHYMSLPLDNLERATKKFSSASARDIDMGQVTNGQMHRQRRRPSIKQFLVS